MLTESPLQRYVLRNIGLLMVSRRDDVTAQQMFKLALSYKSGYTQAVKESFNTGRKNNGAVYDIFADLKSPDTSVRFAALQRIEGSGLSPERQALLSRIMESERDSNLRFQMQKIIAGISIGKEKLRGDDIVSLINMPGRDEMKLALMLESVKKNNASEVRDALRLSNWTKFSSKLIPSVLKFSKTWRQDRFR